MSKPFKGTIYNWKKLYFDKEEVSQYHGEEAGLGYCIEGFTTKTPKLGTYRRTSWVVKIADNENEGYRLVETRNSFYKVYREEGESCNMGL